MKPFYKKLTLNHARGFQYNIKEKIYEKICDISAEYFVTEEPVPFPEISGYQMKPIKLNEVWGKLWDCGWFRFYGEIPENYEKDETVFVIDLSGEGCIFDGNGTPLRGLTNVISDFDRSQGNPGKRIIPVNEITADKNFSFFVEAGCNDLFGKYNGGKLRDAYIAKVNHNLRALYYDYTTLLMLCETIDESEVQHYTILYALEKAYFSLSSDFKAEEIKRARDILSKELSRKNADNPPLEYYAIGHAHMDLAWLWPIRETRRKIGRTFSTVLANMELYPEYIFGASQPQQFQWMKEDYPELYEKFLEKIKSGRIEAQGAMWVEADTNISGGEALVRQILYGKKFFYEECGVIPSLVWLPDVFGFSASLPQIMKKSGVDNFVTIKLSWSEYNKFPHNTFWWEGMDGSRVLVHMPPELDYNGAATPKSIKLATKNFAEKGIVDKAMIVYGIGDGGGGPNRAHLERLQRMENLSGLPPVIQKSSEDYFKDLRKNLPELRVFKGEMYLERHQGTYTTQARNKKYNRRLENALRTAEYISVVANIKNGYKYPFKELEAIWKEVLLYQFHDILPGSSIKRVYDESTARYEILLSDVNSLISEALSAMDKGEDNILNMSPFARKEIFEKDGNWYKIECGALAIAEPEKLTEEFNVSATEEFDSSGAEFLCIENEFISAKFNSDGRLVSLKDKETGQESIKSGNRWQIYNDFGDAWDMNANYRYSPEGCMVLKKTEVFNNGAVSGAIFEFEFNKSILCQTISLKHGAKALEFDHTINWNERGKMLRAEFDTAIVTHEVTCDIQFGSIKRSVSKNYSREFAQFEICAHKWMDLSREDFGLAIINDCKYGCLAEDNKLTVNILRSTDYPGESADIGTHSLRLALMPHKYRVENSGVAEYAYAFNNPLLTVNSKPQSFLSADKNNIVIETVKMAECGKGVVVRMYENKGIPTTAVLSVQNLSQWFETDMTERACEASLIKDGKIELNFAPCEIKTIIIY